MSNNNDEVAYTVAHPLPLLSEDLIKELDDFYPHRIAKPGTPIDKLWFDNGKRALIDELKERLTGTNYAQLKGDMTINV